MFNLTLKIISIIHETDDAVTISFKQPLLKKVRYSCGQYLTIILTINGRKYRRPYSISSTPEIDSTIDITVKRIPHGVVSNHLNDFVKEGDLIEVISPLGDFVFPANQIQIKQLFLWGAGSGITPLYSILKFALKFYPELNVSLIYSNKKAESTIYYNGLLELQKLHPDRFNLIFFFSEEINDIDPQLKYFRHRINSASVNSIINNFEYSNAQHYICGPEELKKTIKNEILRNGTGTKHVFSENFNNIINQEELIDIHSQQVIIKLNGLDNQVEVVRGKSILEAGLDSGLDLPYSCQNGACRLCKAKLISGRLKIISAEESDVIVTDNEYLLCCGYPLTNDIVIELNN